MRVQKVSRGYLSPNLRITQRRVDQVIVSKMEGQRPKFPPSPITSGRQIFSMISPASFGRL